MCRIKITNLDGTIKISKPTDKNNAQYVAEHMALSHSGDGQTDMIQVLDETNKIHFSWECN